MLGIVWTMLSCVAIEISVILAFVGEYVGLRMVMLNVSASSGLKAMSVIDSVAFLGTLISRFR